MSDDNDEPIAVSLLVLMKLYKGNVRNDFELDDSYDYPRVDHHTYTQTHKPRKNLIVVRFSIGIEMSQFMRLWNISHMQTTKVQTSLLIRTVLSAHEPFVYT